MTDEAPQLDSWFTGMGENAEGSAFADVGFKGLHVSGFSEVGFVRGI